MKQLLTSLLASTIAFGAATTVQKYDLEREVDRQRVLWAENRFLIQSATWITYMNEDEYLQREIRVVEQLVNNPGLTDKERLNLYQELSSLRAKQERSEWNRTTYDEFSKAWYDIMKQRRRAFEDKYGHAVDDFSNKMIDKNEEEV